MKGRETERDGTQRRGESKCSLQILRQYSKKNILGLEQKQRQGSITENPAEYWEWKLTGSPVTYDLQSVVWKMQPEGWSLSH